MQTVSNELEKAKSLPHMQENRSDAITWKVMIAKTTQVYKVGWIFTLAFVYSLKYF